MPCTPVAGVLGLASVPLVFPLALSVIVALHVLAAELAKRVFYRKAGF